MDLGFEFVVEWDNVEVFWENVVEDFGKVFYCEVGREKDDGLCWVGVEFFEDLVECWDFLIGGGDEVWYLEGYWGFVFLDFVVVFEVLYLDGDVVGV